MAKQDPKKDFWQTQKNPLAIPPRKKLAGEPTQADKAKHKGYMKVLKSDDSTANVIRKRFDNSQKRPGGLQMKDVNSFKKSVDSLSKDTNKKLGDLDKKYNSLNNSKLKK
jgi:hypothetical protein